MADPTIQTFCCHRGNATDIAVTIIMDEFNTHAYNLVCILSAVLGIVGGLYQILPREEFSNPHRLLSFSATRGRKIIVWLAIADLFASLGILIRSAIWINYKNIMPAIDDNASVIFCSVSSAFTQYFYTATWIWTLCYALDMRLVLAEKESKIKYYHAASWIIPALTTTFGLSLLYVPDANCHTSKSLTTAVFRILPNYFATYIPIAVVMIFNPFLYYRSTKDMEAIITSVAGQFTTKERDLIDAIKIKFSAVNLVFYVCWVPNLVNGILLWTFWFKLPATWVISIWYLMAFVNPLQALFNCFVYRRWNRGSEKIVVPWRRTASSILYRSESATSTASGHNYPKEILPLLNNTPPTSINHGRKRYN